MARLPLQTLPAFRAVARLGHVRVAAEQMHLTHSAVSQQIRLLEEQVGVRLFDRRQRRLVLNEAGQALLQATEAALDRLHAGLHAARAAGGAAGQRLRVTALPSFSQRWLLPRMARWRERHPDIALELHTSLDLVDLARDGFDAALRQGHGQWRGLVADRLIDSPVIAVGSPTAAARLKGRGDDALADEPLLGDGDLWTRWFEHVGRTTPVRPVATFSDAGLMLQAVEQGLGIALVRELMAADALRDGRLVRLAARTWPGGEAVGMWLAYLPERAGWPPLEAFAAWLRDEMARSREDLAALDAR